MDHLDKAQQCAAAASENHKVPALAKAIRDNAKLHALLDIAESLRTLVAFVTTQPAVPAPDPNLRNFGGKTVRVVNLADHALQQPGGVADE